MQIINETFKEVSTKFKNVDELSELILKLENMDEEDKSMDFLKEFMFTAEEEIKKTELRIKNIDTVYAEVISLFGDNPKEMPMETFIEIIIKFSKDVKVKYN